MVSQKIKISDLDEPIASRFTAKKLCERTIKILENKEVDKVTFDFREIEYLSTGVARDLFGNLYIELRDEFTDKIDFVFDENKEIILSSIARGLKAADYK